jgi:hypothetical protein
MDAERHKNYYEEFLQLKTIEKESIQELKLKLPKLIDNEKLKISFPKLEPRTEESNNSNNGAIKINGCKKDGVESISMRNFSKKTVFNNKFDKFSTEKK